MKALKHGKHPNAMEFAVDLSAYIQRKAIDDIPCCLFWGRSQPDFVRRDPPDPIFPATVKDFDLQPVPLVLHDSGPCRDRYPENFFAQYEFSGLGLVIGENCFISTEYGRPLLGADQFHFGTRLKLRLSDAKRLGRVLTITDGALASLRLFCQKGLRFDLGLRRWRRCRLGLLRKDRLPARA